jgi:transposase-like protein
MSERKRRVFTPQFKLGLVRRMEAGESATVLSRELSIKRELLYDWQRLWRREGAKALRQAGRPTAVESLARAAGPPKSLVEAERQIAALERKVGQQALELIFSDAPCSASRVTPAERRVRRAGVFADIQAMTPLQGMGPPARLAIEGMCQLAGVAHSHNHCP